MNFQHSCVYFKGFIAKKTPQPKINSYSGLGLTFSLADYRLLNLTFPLAVPSTDGNTDSSTDSYLHYVTDINKVETFHIVHYTQQELTCMKMT